MLLFNVYLVPDVPNVDVLPVYSYDSQTLSSLNITIDRAVSFINPYTCNYLFSVIVATIDMWLAT